MGLALMELEARDSRGFFFALTAKKLRPPSLRPSLRDMVHPAAWLSVSTVCIIERG